MRIQEHIAPAYENLLRLARQAKLIQFHPLSRYRSLLVARLLGDPQVRTHYYALDIDDINLFNFLTGLMNSLSKQHATFGRHLNMLPPTVLDDPYAHLDTLLGAFLKEIDEIGSAEYFLIFDEFDRADPADDVHRFVERLSYLMPNHCTIVLNGRTLPRLPWLSLIAKGHGLIVKDERLVTEDIYGVRNDKNASLKVLSIGPGYVFRDDYLVDSWEGHLPRLLLFYVMDRPEATRNQICETFWPDLELDQAVNVFHVTKRRLHKALGIDILSHDGTYYRIATDISFYFDAFDFVETLLKCRHGQPEDELAQWQRIDKLCRGPFLQGHHDAWIEERREAYSLAHIESLLRIADLWSERGNDELALLTLGKAIDSDYSLEMVHLRLLRLYVKLGRRAEAVAHYRDLEKWAKANKSPLSDATKQLFSDITA